MKRIKMIISILMALILVFTSGLTSVKADAMEDMGKIVDGSLLTDQNESEDISFSLAKGTDLYQGRAKISALSSNKINAFGMTAAYHDCDDIDLYLFIEQYKNGSWSTYDIYQYTGHNISVLSKSVNLQVESGYYYRLRGYHRTYNDGRQESTSTTTNGIYIG